MKPMTQALLHVAVPIALLVVLVFNGLFDSAHTEVGYEHYAERADPDWGFVKFPPWLKMPANSLVNLGYCVIGAAWMYLIAREKELGEVDRYMYYVFGWQAVIYGGVQYARIATQLHRWAILDQWLTFPFFAWVTVWSEYLLRGWNGSKIALIMLVSVLLYLPHTLHHRGFELGLGIHVVFAVVSAARVHLRCPVKENLAIFIYALLCCAGFVFLKLSDHYLARFALFRYLTGHFWSKVCDFLQIHFVSRFFFNINRHIQMTKKEG